MSRQSRDLEPVDDFMRRNLAPNRWDAERAAFYRAKAIERAALDKQPHIVNPEAISATAARRIR